MVQFLSHSVFCRNCFLFSNVVFRDRRTKLNQTLPPVRNEAYLTRSSATAESTARPTLVPIESVYATPLYIRD